MNIGKICAKNVNIPCTKHDCKDKTIDGKTNHVQARQKRRLVQIIALGVKQLNISFLVYVNTNKLIFCFKNLR